MARITVEDCLVQENNRFALVQLASKRTKQLLQGSSAQIEDRRNKAVVTALREIADGCVRFMTAEEAKAFEEQQAELAEQERAARMAEQQPAKEVASNLFGDGADTSSLDFLRETLMQPGPISANADDNDDSSEDAESDSEASGENTDELDEETAENSADKAEDEQA
jgi:DNA-directed RNA polymerase subunit omega